MRNEPIFEQHPSAVVVYFDGALSVRQALLVGDRLRQMDASARGLRVDVRGVERFEPRAVALLRRTLEQWERRSGCRASVSGQDAILAVRP